MFFVLGRSKTCENTVFLAFGHNDRQKNVQKAWENPTFLHLAPRLPHAGPMLRQDGPMLAQDGHMLAQDGAQDGFWIAQ